MPRVPVLPHRLWAALRALSRRPANDREIRGRALHRRPAPSKFGAAEGGRHHALRRLPGAVPHPAGPRRRLRPLCQRGRPARARRSGGAAERPVEEGAPLVDSGADDWDGTLLDPARTFVTGVGAGTTYPDYKPAPFIVSAEHDGVDTVTVVTEGIFSYCGVKVKIDTDRHLGPEPAAVRVQGRAGRPRHHGRIRLADAVARRRASPHRRLQEGGQRHLRRRCSKLCTGEAVELAIDGGHA